MKVLITLAAVAVTSALSFADLKTSIDALKTAGNLKRCNWDGDCTAEKCLLNKYSNFLGTPPYTAIKAAGLVASYTTQANLVTVTGTGVGYCKPVAECAATFAGNAATNYVDVSGDGFTLTKACDQPTNPAGAGGAAAGGAQTKA